MKHFFMEIDDLVITHGDIQKTALCDSVPYRVERAGKDGGIDFVQGSLPACTPVESRGFSESELRDIESLIRDNMLLIYDKLRGQGAWA